VPGNADPSLPLRMTFAALRMTDQRTGVIPVAQKDISKYFTYQLVKIITLKAAIVNCPIFSYPLKTVIKVLTTIDFFRYTQFVSVYVSVIVNDYTLFSRRPAVNNGPAEKVCYG
jgi:hypothetical protein